MSRRFIPPALPAHPDGSGRRRTLPPWLAARLTPRHRYVLRVLLDHRVLTTTHIAQLAYPSQDRARHNMALLDQLPTAGRPNSAELVERFRPPRPPGEGTSPIHYVIGPAGAQVLAAESGIPLSELGYRRDRLVDWSRSPELPHLLGINGIFASLADGARHHPCAELADWRPEHQCGFARPAHPDAFGTWREGGPNGVSVYFFLEYDTGSEPLPKVVHKLRGYQRLARINGFTTPVLIWTSSPRREAHLHAKIGTPPIPVFTTTSQARNGPLGPAGSVWLPVDSRHVGAPRLRLITLSRYARPFPYKEAEGEDT